MYAEVADAVIAVLHSEAQAVRVTGSMELSPGLAAALKTCGVDSASWDDILDGLADCILWEARPGEENLLTRFSEAWSRLREDGWLVGIGFSAPRWTLFQSGPLRADQFEQVAAYCGFGLRESRDLSAILAKCLETHRTAADTEGGPIPDLSRLWVRVSGQEAEGEPPAMILQALRAGQLRYGIRVFRKSDRRWRALRAGQRFDIFSQLFEESFDARVSEEAWHWKYGAKDSLSLLAASDEGPVAHYGALGRQILYFGRPVLACQPVDVLVRPGVRGVLTRKGPFFVTAAALLESSVGYGRQYLLCYGFPTGRHLELGERLGMYADGGEMFELAWEPLFRSRWSFGVVHELTGASLQELQRWVAPAWEDMRRELQNAIVCVRDAEWLDWRYSRHPDKEYRIFAVRRHPFGRGVGIIVVRAVEGQCELMDVVGSLAEVPTLITAARWVAAQMGAHSLFAWVSALHAPRFLATGGTSRGNPCRFAIACWTNAPSIAEVYERWWLMSGDTDFR